MKKTLQIHIGGRHIHIDEDGYNKLNHYLESLKSHFAGEGESGKEIVGDIEQRIAELLEKKITDSKQAVSLDDVQETIGILGKVEDFVYGGTSGQESDSAPYDRRDNRRLFRDGDSSYLGGVASGMGAYFDIDPLWIRLAFVALIFLKGVGIIIYAILWMVVPKARTTGEKLQMQGKPVTLSTIKESVNAEYDKVKTSLDGMSKSGTADRTRNALENIIRAIGLVILAIFKFIIGVIGVFFLVLGSIFLAALIMLLLGFTNIFGHIQIWNGLHMPDLSHLFASTGHYYLLVGALVVVVLIPIVALIYGGTKILFNIRTKHPVLRAFLLTAWILSLILCITLVIVNSTNYAVEASGEQSAGITAGKNGYINVQVRDNTEHKKMTVYRVFDERFQYSEGDESLYARPDLFIEKSGDAGMHLTIEKQVKNVGIKNSQRFLDRISYNWEQQDTALYLDKYLVNEEEDFWLFPEVDIKLQLPEGQEIILSEAACELLESYQYDRYCSDSLVAGKRSIMTTDGLMLLERYKKQHPKNK
jgi:phage shock protein PspC (stress-responsive transcriptional regulator)